MRFQYERAVYRRSNHDGVPGHEDIEEEDRIRAQPLLIVVDDVSHDDQAGDCRPEQSDNQDYEFNPSRQDPVQDRNQKAQDRQWEHAVPHRAQVLQQ